MKNKIWMVLAVIIFIAVILVSIIGFNVGSVYKNYVLVDINIGQDFEMKDIEKIANEVCGKGKVEVNRAGVYSDNIVLKVQEISNEQIESLNIKINEKYGISNKTEDIKTKYIPSFRLRDLVKVNIFSEENLGGVLGKIFSIHSYIGAFLLVTVLVLIYMVICFRKIGIGKVISKTILSLIIAELTYVSVLAIVRFPINELFIPIGITIYIMVSAILFKMFEKQESVKEAE